MDGHEKNHGVACKLRRAQDSAPTSPFCTLTINQRVLDAISLIQAPCDSFLFELTKITKIKTTSVNSLKIPRFVPRLYSPFFFDPCTIRKSVPSLKWRFYAYKESCACCKQFATVFDTLSTPLLRRGCRRLLSAILSPSYCKARGPVPGHWATVPKKTTLIQ